jgi:hypothetical protein
MQTILINNDDVKEIKCWVLQEKEIETNLDEIVKPVYLACPPLKW